MNNSEKHLKSWSAIVEQNVNYIKLLSLNNSSLIKITLLYEGRMGSIKAPNVLLVSGLRFCVTPTE